MIAMAVDAWIALGLAAIAAAFLARRGVRALSKKGGGCECPSAASDGACGAAGTMGDELKAAAARGAEKAGRPSSGPEPGPGPGAPSR